jgi:chromate transporter
MTELLVLFLRLGLTAFGGPAAHIAMMEEEVVRRRGWLTRAEFLDLLGATNLIPGPNSTEMAIHIGWRRGRWAGLLVAGVAFILPAALLVAGIAWAYVRFRQLPILVQLFDGIRPVILAVVAQALWILGRQAVKSVVLGVIGVAAVVAVAFGVHELVVLFAGAAVAALAARPWRAAPPAAAALVPMLPWAPATTTAAGGAVAAGAGAAVGLWPLFAFFLKVGSVLFGSGYVLLAFLRADLVERWHWLSDGQLLDAIVVGQVTPGPVFTTATFIGYLLHGGTGALVATLGIFAPAFVFVALSAPIVPRLRRSRWAGAFLDGLNVASLALMAVVSWFLARAALHDAWTIALAVVSALLLLRFRVSSVWLVVGAAAVAGVRVALAHLG